MLAATHIRGRDPDGTAGTRTAAVALRGQAAPPNWCCTQERHHIPRLPHACLLASPLNPLRTPVLLSLPGGETPLLRAQPLLIWARKERATRGSKTISLDDEPAWQPAFELRRVPLALGGDEEVRGGVCVCARTPEVPLRTFASTHRVIGMCGR